jgi:hypothetical protein
MRCDAMRGDGDQGVPETWVYVSVAVWRTLIPFPRSRRYLAGWVVRWFGAACRVVFYGIVWHAYTCLACAFEMGVYGLLCTTIYCDCAGTSLLRNALEIYLFRGKEHIGLHVYMFSSGGNQQTAGTTRCSARFISTPHTPPLPSLPSHTTIYAPSHTLNPPFRIFLYHSLTYGSATCGPYGSRSHCGRGGGKPVSAAHEAMSSCSEPPRSMDTPSASAWA